MARPSAWLGTLFLVSVAFAPKVHAQEVFQEMPRYDRYQKLIRSLGGMVVSGALRVTWDADGKSFTFQKDGKTIRHTVATGQQAEVTEKAAPNTPGRRNRNAPERGRQFDKAFTADGTKMAFVKDRNVVIADADGKNPRTVTTDGNEKDRTKYGVASWVYGEELEVRESMWFSPDGKNLAYYRFDESPVRDYYLAMDQAQFQATLDVEAYPKAGQPNPKVQLLVSPMEGEGKTVIDTSFGDATLGEYVYDVRWSADGNELYYYRTNRKQNVMQFCAADPATGKSRVVVEERYEKAWVENHPTVIFLKDGKRFLWFTEKSGFARYELRDLSGKFLGSVTPDGRDASRDASGITVLEDQKAVFYTASGPKNPYFIQLYRVGLDGKGDQLLTDPDLHHEITLAPDGKHFVDIAQNPSTPAVTRLIDLKGKTLATLKESDVTKFNEAGLKKTELFTFKAADGTTDCYGTLQFPSDFDPAKRYPVILSVYAGPESGGPNVRFSTPSALTELGFLVVNIAGRGTLGRGKAFRDAVYGKLGVVEIDDQAAGVKALAARPYVDGKNVGIFGTSYGGYASAMAILRHPDVFKVACASSSVTDWRHYDTIYTERYMGLPWDNENKAGYDAGSASTYVKQLKGHLMLYFGSADNNVHPSNTYKLIRDLEREGKRYDLQVGPDAGHTQMNSVRMWEYFMKWLILNPSAKPQAAVWRGKSTVASRDSRSGK